MQLKNDSWTERTMQLTTSSHLGPQALLFPPSSAILLKYA